MFCSKCGNLIENQGDFCPYCGNKNGGSYDVKNKSVFVNEKKKKAKIFVSIACAFALVFVAFGFFASFFSKHDDYKKSFDEKLTVDNANVKNDGDVIVEDNADDKIGFSINEVEIGQVICFGSYEQDNDISNGREKIEWIILDKQDSEILVISKYALDCQPYNETKIDITWEQSTLRYWLNDDFINSAFTMGEQMRIPTVTVLADSNSEFKTKPGDDTNDKVFLLSEEEINRYFADEEKRMCRPTEYVKTTRIVTDSETGNCGWWLRTPGAYQNHTSSVRDSGSISKTGFNVNFVSLGVRPAIWINLDE